MSNARCTDESRIPIDSSITGRYSEQNDHWDHPLNIFHASTMQDSQTFRFRKIIIIVFAQGRPNVTVTVHTKQLELNLLVITTISRIFIVYKRTDVVEYFRNLLGKHHYYFKDYFTTFSYPYRLLNYSYDVSRHDRYEVNSILDCLGCVIIVILVIESDTTSKNMHLSLLFKPTKQDGLCKMFGK